MNTRAIAAYLLRALRAVFGPRVNPHRFDTAPDPLQYAHSTTPRAPQVALCGCGMRYLRRPALATPPENGQCYRCAMGADRPPIPTNAQVEHNREVAASIAAMRVHASRAVANFHDARTRGARNRK